MKKLISIMISIWIFVSFSTAYAQRINLPPIDIYGDDGPRRPQRNPIGDGESPVAEKARKAAERKAAELRAAEAQRAAEAAAQAKRTEIEKEKMKIYVREVAMMVLGDIAKAQSFPLWVIWEVSTRTLDPTEVGHHPMESGKIQADPEAMKKLRIELDREAKETREKYKKANAKDIPLATRTLNNREGAIVATAMRISPDAAVVAETLVRYNLGEGGNKNFGAAPSAEFASTVKPPVANACWSKKAKIARTLPYTQPGQTCEAFKADGKPIRQAGITTFRPFANVCAVQWGKCELPVKEVVGVPCRCFGGSRPGDGISMFDESSPSVSKRLN